MCRHHERTELIAQPHAITGYRQNPRLGWFAFLGALVAMVLVYLIGTTGRAVVTPVRMLLAGVAIGAVMEGHPRCWFGAGTPRNYDTATADRLRSTTSRPR
ncbi:iron chelate uptake ABC transporter family permease subunit [Mycolicibacterium sp. Dal123E01]|uniref:iron chelate uptake ABC transporter family permease subunit n=1 Tax=Mycolicibacterium sp. Dal123E01 TaxID=3457578 RepID=UPI00403E5760